MGVEEEQQVTVLGEVVVVAESLVKRGGVAVARWSCGGSVELRWLGGGSPPRLAWPRRRPVVEKELVDWGMEVPGLPSADSGRCFI